MLHSCIHHCCTAVPPLPPLMTLLLLLLLSLFQCLQMPAAPPDRSANSIDSCDSTASSIAFQLPPSASNSTTTLACGSESPCPCPIPTLPSACSTPLVLLQRDGTSRHPRWACPAMPPEHPVTRCPHLRCTVTVHRWPSLHHPLIHATNSLL